MIKDFIFVFVSTIAVILGLTLGFREIKPPSLVRAQMFDALRHSNITSIKYDVDDYYYKNYQLPEVITNLPKRTYSTNVDYRADPETKQAYIYKKTSDKSYELCANFTTDADASAENKTFSASSTLEDTHQAGLYCYKLVVGQNTIQNTMPQPFKTPTSTPIPSPSPVRWPTY